MKNIKKEQLIGISPNSNLFKQYKASLKSLSQIQFEASIGLVLGDASLNTGNNGKTYRLKFEWSDKHRAYIDYVNNIFEEWIISPPHKKERTSPIWSMNDLLSKVVLPKVNIIIERGRIEKDVDLELVDNKYKNLNISSIINNNNDLLKDSLNKLLYNVYNKTSLEKESKLKGRFAHNEDFNIRDVILDNIKYKTMGGAKLIVKGRLTKRYRADRAVYKLKWKGGLKNIDSAFKGLSTVQYRGYLDSNVQKSSLVSKRRIGSFGVRSWISGKNYSTSRNTPVSVVPAKIYANADT